MRKIITAFILISTATLFNTAVAQEDKVKRDNETEQIIIRKKGDKDTDLRIEIKGDNIIVNGKPLSEFKDENITINKGKIIIRDKDVMAFNFNEDMAKAWQEKNKEWVEKNKQWIEKNKQQQKQYKDFMHEWNEENLLSRAFLGVTTVDDTEGAKITEISKESAAAKSDLKVGDIITKIGDKKVDGPSSLSEIISTYKPKDKVKVFYKRDGKEKNVNATLGEKKNAMAFAFRSPEGGVRSFTIPRMPALPPMHEWNGNEFKGLEGLNNIEIFSRRQKLGLRIQDTEDGNGIKVLGTDKDSPAEKAGLQKDDVITEIAGKKVNNTDDAREQLQEVQDKTSYNIKAKRNGSEMSFDVKIPKKLKTANL